MCHREETLPCYFQAGGGVGQGASIHVQNAPPHRAEIRDESALSQRKSLQIPLHFRAKLYRAADDRARIRGGGGDKSMKLRRQLQKLNLRLLTNGRNTHGSSPHRPCRCTHCAFGLRSSAARGSEVHNHFIIIIIKNSFSSDVNYEANFPPFVFAS